MANFDWRALLSGVSSLAPVLAQSRATRRAQDELERGNAATRAAQATADKRIGDEIASVGASTGEPERRQSAADYTAAVRKVRNEGNSSIAPTLGGNRYQQQTQAENAAGTAYGNKAADLYARMTAPGLQRQREAEGSARARVDVGREVTRARSAQSTALMRAKNRAQVSPWVAILSALGGQIANSYETQDERSIGVDPYAELQPIDLTTIPRRLSPPRRLPDLRQLPPFPGG